MTPLAFAIARLQHETRRYSKRERRIVRQLISRSVANPTLLERFADILAYRRMAR